VLVEPEMLLLSFSCGEVQLSVAARGRGARAVLAVGRAGPGSLVLGSPSCRAGTDPAEGTGRVAARSPLRRSASARHRLEQLQSPLPRDFCRSKCNPRSAHAEELSWFVGFQPSPC